MKEHLAPMHMGMIRAITNRSPRTYCGLDADDVVLATSESENKNICAKCKKTVNGWRRDYVYDIRRSR